MEEPERPKRKQITAEEARQGEIILKTRTQRVIFLAGLVGAILLAIIGSFLVR